MLNKNFKVCGCRRVLLFSSSHLASPSKHAVGTGLLRCTVQDTAGFVAQRCPGERWAGLGGDGVGAERRLVGGAWGRAALGRSVGGGYRRCSGGAWHPGSTTLACSRERGRGLEPVPTGEQRKWKIPWLPRGHLHTGVSYGRCLWLPSAPRLRCCCFCPLCLPVWASQGAVPAPARLVGAMPSARACLVKSQACGG